ncbi:MAG: hypothetical protein B7Z43_10335, partial [Sphingomonas sp. 12-62-6]
MALAKLCACTCGGALIGGGAVHVTESAQPRAAYVKKVHTKRVVRTAARRPGTRVRRVVTRTQTSCPPAVITVASQGTPVPLPPPYLGSSGEFPVSSSGGGGGPILVGGSSGFGGGGFFAGGFFGGGG